jgi:putative nucleotidyltransferase with HDIG domain
MQASIVSGGAFLDLYNTFDPLKIPSKNNCFQLMCEMHMLENIVAHSLQVCRVATLLTENLLEQGFQLNFDLIQGAALLHDITKTRSFKTQENHAVTGGQFLTDRGYPEVGSIVRQHVRLYEYPKPLTLGEAQIINYADKRVLHDEIVPLDKRLDYILGKYAKIAEHRERTRWLWKKTREIEAEIFRTLSFSPDDLTHLINSEDRSVDLLEFQQICQSVLKNPSSD